MGAGITLAPNAVRALDWLGLGAELRGAGCDVVMELRESEASAYTALDTPIFTCHRKGLPEILERLG